MVGCVVSVMYLLGQGLVCLVCMCMCVHMYVYIIYIYIHVYIHIYMNIYASKYTCVFWLLYDLVKYFDVWFSCCGVVV